MIFHISHLTRGRKSQSSRGRTSPLHCASMKLSSKGRFAAPPRLPESAQSVSEALASWPDVHARTHWLLGDEQEVDGADFYVGEDEIGHIHLGGEAHVAVGKKLAAALIAAGRAKPFRWSDEFVVFSIRSKRDVHTALALFQLAYDRRRGTPMRDLIAQVTTPAAPEAADRV